MKKVMTIKPSKSRPRVTSEQQLNQKLLPHAETLIAQWTPDVRREVDELVMRNPAREDRELGSFKFNVTTGAWSDFAAPEQFKGNGLVQLYAAINGITTPRAVEKLSNAAVPTISRPAARPAEQPSLNIQPVDDHAVGVPLPPDVHPDLGVPSNRYEYREGDGKIAFYVDRFEINGKKETRPVSWSAAKSIWVCKYPPSPWPLYARGPATNDVLVVEGEKTADAAAAQFPHLRVVTSASGSGQAGRSDWSLLKGKNVIISPDNDAAGRGYALSVAGQAEVVGAITVKVVDNSTLGWAAGDDLADHTVAPEYLDQAVDVKEYAEASEREPGIVAAAAQLGIGDYDRAKDRLASSLSISRRALDALVKAARVNSSHADEEEAEAGLRLGEVEPWDQPVDGQHLFDELVGALNRYVVLQPGQPAAVALWCMLSWQYERFKILPQLLLSSPVKRCGKTTLLEVISYNVNRPLAASNLTGPAVFRAIEQCPPTLLIDEADTFLGDGAKTELTGVLNSGHNRTLAYVIRVEEVEGQRVPMRFSTFCPKVLAMIDTPADTQLDRSIVIEMQRKPAKVVVEALGLNAEQSFQDLRRKLARWRDDTPDTFEHDLEACPSLPSDRARQNWSALLSVARLVGPAAHELGLEAVRLLSDTRHLEVDRGADLLADIRTVFSSKRAQRMPSKELLKGLNEMPDRPWATCNRGRELNGHGLAKALRPFKIGPRSYKDGGKTIKGYQFSDLGPVFERYLGAEDAE
jgi:hypothetical protein